MGMNRYLDFVISVGTQLSFLPSLKLIYARRRHFECFIAVFHLFTSIMFSASKTLRRPILLESIQWHLLSDVMTETYLMMLNVHLIGLKSEDKMMALRYIAFALLWVGKLADGWDNMQLQTVVMIAYSVYPIGHVLDAVSKYKVLKLKRRMPYRKTAIKPAVGCLISGIVLFVICGGYESRRGVSVFYESLLASGHVFFGVGSFYLWSLLPCFDKSDEVPLYM